MSEYREGEWVRATIEGPVTQDALGSLYVNVGDGIDAEIPVEALRVTVERADPEWWPPRPSDLLRNTSTGSLWFAVAIGSNTNLYNDRADQIEPQQAWEQRHRLTLVHREDEQDGGAR